MLQFHKQERSQNKLIKALLSNEVKNLGEIQPPSELRTLAVQNEVSKLKTFHPWSFSIRKKYN